jgi:hypothetical protein
MSVMVAASPWISRRIAPRATLEAVASQDGFQDGRRGLLLKDEAGLRVGKPCYMRPDHEAIDISSLLRPRQPHVVTKSSKRLDIRFVLLSFRKMRAARITRTCARVALSIERKRFLQMSEAALRDEVYFQVFLMTK